MISRAKAAALAVAAIALVIDQSTKAWAVSSLHGLGQSHTFFGPIDLTLSMNHSNAFGLTPVVGGWTRWGLTAANLAVAGAVLVTIVRRQLHLLTALGLACIAAGALGNAIDRIRMGAVVDFIDASKLSFPWIFNVADATLDVGIGLIALSALLARPSKDA
jgi:signal peptidase II